MTIENLPPCKPQQQQPLINSDRLLRWRDVEPIVGICRSHAHQLIAKGLFPKPCKLVPGGRASAWPESEIKEWVQQRIASVGDEKAA